MNKQESKYQYTASLMDEALLLLLEQKDYEFITVKEVCQKAGVNRSTCYLHYESMNDLLEETVGMINDRFKKSLSSVPTDMSTAHFEIRLTDYFGNTYTCSSLTSISDISQAWRLPDGLGDYD